MEIKIMLSPVRPDNRPTQKPLNLELDPTSRSHRLRQMHWEKTHQSSVIAKPIVGSGEDTLTGHAKDFAMLLEASDPFIQADELIVGSLLVSPANPELINLGEYDPHYPPGYKMLISRGFQGMRDEAQKKLQTTTDSDSQDFLKAVVISFEAACQYAAKFARYAENMEVDEPDPNRKQELANISMICDELATGRPTSFHSALQLLQFTRVFGGRGCIGRFDQWMYPFYRDDIDNGRITRSEGQELLECFFIKTAHFPHANLADNDTLRNIAVAGQTTEGHDSSNELSYMCIEASGKLMLAEPKINVRFFEGTPHELLRATAQVLAKGANNLAIFNDEVAVPSLVQIGIPIEEARDYCNDGCSELIMGGKGTIKFKVTDAIPVLNELVYSTASTAGKNFPTFDKVMADYKSRLTEFMPDGSGPARPVTFPFFAAAIEDCLEEASPAAARYAINGKILAQVGNAADGLAAIRQLIFDERSLSWDQLRAAMEANFEGYESLYQTLKTRTAKFGNDNDYVDSIAKEIAEFFCDGVHERSQNTEGPGGKWAPGFMSFGIHRKSDHGASPDGRKKGELTANSFSPAVGMDTSGPTAVLRSVAK
ncbi:MAG: hypothetical protein CMO12_01010, partial [Thaumarchaeota archaeon]|nr:hypothetical protein [Nitrososphaerota archaeon]